MTFCSTRLFAAGISLCAFALNASAQTKVSVESFPYMKETSPSAEDIEWKALLDARKADELEFAQLPAQATSKAAAISKRAAKSVKAADKAKEFYEKHPDHKQAGEARRLEILSLLQNEADEGENLNGRLKNAVSDLRSDKKISATTRALGAAAYDFSRAHRAAKNEKERRENAETVARQLVAEFPTEAPGYQALLLAARLSRVSQGEALAREIVNSASAPTELRMQAQVLIDRAALVGKPLADVLGGAGAALLVPAAQGQPKIVYSWATWAPGTVEFGKMIQARRFNAIAVCLDTDLSSARSFQKKFNLGGEHVYDEMGKDGGLAAKLKFSPPGQVYLVDANGIIRDINGGAEFEQKIHDLGFQTPPIVPPASSR